MFKVNRLRIEILSDKSESISELFGFDYGFKDGLNIVAGHNSRGKTTINSCIYYALGMEELLGGHNEKALDKSLKEEFTTYSSEDEEINHNIIHSKVLLEIESQNGISTLVRYIKTDNSEHKTNVINITLSDMEKIEEAIETKGLYYVNGTGNNDDENGFYNWLASFIGIEIPIVSNTSRKDNYGPLYLQIIFSTLLIEQTKGWSDFFATMPFFGVPKAKEKNIEFLLNLNELNLSTEKDVLSKKKNELSEKWRNTIKSFELIAKQYNCSYNELPVELTTEESEIKKIAFSFSTSEGEKISLKSNLAAKESEYKTLENLPISKIETNKEDILIEYQKQKEEYFELKEYIKKFQNKFEIENFQYENLGKQIKRIIQEIKDHDSLKKVFNLNIINKKGGNYCPTCSQEVSLDLISSQNIEIPKLGLDENTAFLKGQKKLIETSQESLQEIIKEKKILLEYFNGNLRQKEILIKSLSRDLIADDRAFSESEVVRKLQIEKEIENLKFIESKITELKESLIEISNKYYNGIIELNSLKSSEDEDESKLKSFEALYKELLFSFGYESNEKWKISINRKEPFKYFPVYNKHRDDKTPQSIRINSSASDFVRNIWAYSISLLLEGSNHPGLLIFDEPGQHRTNIKSLKSLFSVCSLITDRQIIIFTSIDKKINDDEKLEIEELTANLTEGSFKLIRLDDKHKVIQKLI